MNRSGWVPMVGVQVDGPAGEAGGGVRGLGALAGVFGEELVTARSVMAPVPRMAMMRTSSSSATDERAAGRAGAVWWGS